MFLLKTKMNLTDLIEQINKNYSQSEISTKIFDFETVKETEAVQPDIQQGLAEP